MKRALAAIALLCAVGGAPAQSGWFQRLPSVHPSLRGFHLFTYDVSRGVNVLFGGWPSLGDTWEWNGTSWAQRTPAHAPPPRCCGAHGYDLARSRVVLFGGMTASLSLNDTWEYDGTDWVQIVSPVAPSPRHLAAMAFDLGRGRLVLFGGGTATNATPMVEGDMWEWNGVAWSQLLPAHLPPARWGLGMACDLANARVLLHGGSTDWANQTVTFQDTWSWNGTDWTQIATAATPPAVMTFGFTYDWTRGVAMLFGGSPNSGETWLFTDNTWVRDPRPTSPGARRGCTLDYDVLRGRVPMFGGEGMGDTWEYVVELSAWRPFGFGCAGSQGVPRLQPVATARPVLGTTFSLELVAVPPNGLAAIAIGFSSAAWSGGALPAPLAAMGMPGCTLFAAPEFLFTTPVTAGRATLSWPLPNLAGLAGTTFYNQAILLDPGVNTFGAVVSNAGVGVIWTL